ncbi:hypothetical protein, partial [Candidatus Entotheonella palauensis]|uniref:hypothetical protein n=1 Tax=Candidatus Entotheonella palauensis TaxID=93172 RepID=UPI001C4DE8D1
MTQLVALLDDDFEIALVTKIALDEGGCRSDVLTETLRWSLTPWFVFVVIVTPVVAQLVAFLNNHFEVALVAKIALDE